MLYVQKIAEMLIAFNKREKKLWQNMNSSQRMKKDIHPRHTHAIKVITLTQSSI